MSAPELKDNPEDSVEKLRELWQQGQQPDVDSFAGTLGPLSTEQWGELLRIDQQQRWQIGRHVRAEEYLQRYPQIAARSELSLDLICNEFLVRKRLGESVHVEEYLQRFPERAEALADQIELQQAVRASEQEDQERVRSSGTALFQVSPEPPPQNLGPDSATPTTFGQNDSVPQQLGEFHVLREIGRGGMGVVYEAEQRSLQRRVALKVIFTTYLDAELEARFVREAELVAQLHHTNIVPIFAFGKVEGVHYYAMQLIAGKDLATVCAESPTGNDPKQVATWGLQAAEALCHAHARGIIHRDVKPSNLLLDEAGVVWLTDFGLARPIDETRITATGALLGTPRYVSPEQLIDSRTVGPLSDLYSLGATLYELATGRSVFPSDNLAQLLVDIRETEPIPPRQLRRELPRDLETIILTCLAKDPHRRYASARELADDLRAFTEDRAIKARRPPLTERAMRWVRKQRFTPVGLLKVVVAVAMLILWGTLLVQELQGERSVELTVRDAPASQSVRGYTVEILELDREEEVIPPFNVPMAGPTHVSPGSYRLRASRPGWLSTTKRINVSNRQGNAFFTIILFDAPGGRLSGNLNAIHLQPDTKGYLPRPHLWPQPNRGALNNPKDQPAHPLDGAFLVEPVRSEVGHDLITLRRSSIPGQGATGITVRKLAGKTGSTLWETNMHDENRMAKRWRGYLHTANNRPPSLVAIEDNLIFADRMVPALVCFSAKTGEVNWICGERGKPVPGLMTRADAVDQPVICEGKELGQSGFVTYVRPSFDRNVELWGVGATTGQLVWKVEIPDTKLQRPYYLSPSFPARPVLTRVSNRPTVVCLAGKQLIGIDLATGDPAWPIRQLPFRPVQSLHCADLDGDGDGEALLLQSPEKHWLSLSALRLDSGRKLWEQRWQGELETAWEVGEPKTISPPWDWPLVVDLDDDGRPEVIVRGAVLHEDSMPRKKRPQGQHFVERSDLLSIDGRSGEIRWRRRLGRTALEFHSGWVPLRLLTGEDVDGDGHREIMAVTVMQRWHVDFHVPREVYVDAVSGRTGKSLWWLRRPLHFRNSSILSERTLSPGKPCWWKVSRNEAPLFVLPMTHNGDMDRSFVLGPSGQILHSIPKVRRARSVDLDGDGRAELLGELGRQYGEKGPREWCVIAGWAPSLVPVEYVPQPEKEDPRQYVPLPWSRNFLMRTWQLISFSDLFLRTEALLILIPFSLLAFVIGRWISRRSKRRYKGVAVDKAQKKRGNRTEVLLIVLGMLTALLIGAIWLHVARDELAPGEKYFWEKWYGQWAMVGVMCLSVYAGLYGLLILGKRLWIGNKNG